MIVLGIDPGLRSTNPTGWAWLDHRDRMASGLLVPPARGAWEMRIEAVAVSVEALINERRFDALICEDCFLGDDAATFKKLACFGWEMRVLARRYDLPFFLVAPNVQHHTLKTFPFPLRSGNPHEDSARAIAWVGRSMLERKRKGVPV